MKNVKEFTAKIEGEAWSNALDKAFNKKKKDIKRNFRKKCKKYFIDNEKRLNFIFEYFDDAKNREVINNLIIITL